jgi:hypothetical protein
MFVVYKLREVVVNLARFCDFAQLWGRSKERGGCILTLQKLWLKTITPLTYENEIAHYEPR